MSQWISCTVIASKVVLVECKDDDADPGCTAADIAGWEAFEGTFDEITTLVVKAEDLDSAKRHADVLVGLSKP